MLKLAILNSDYCEYLRRYDYRAPLVYNNKQVRPFIGVLFHVQSIMYFAPLSSPKLKHLKYKDQIDFIKIEHGNLGVINLNNMIPVLSSNVFFYKNDDISNIDRKYYILLLKQKHWIKHNSEKVINYSRKLYEKYNNGSLNQSITSRCCNFKLLEEKCLEYNKINN